MLARGHTLGVMTFGLIASSRVYGSQELLFAEHLAGRIAIAMDNSRLYEEAQRAIRARDNVLAVVSHDLRNPLGTIVMSTAQLLRSAAGDDRRKQSRRYLDSIRRAAQAMNRLIADLVDVASLEAGRFALARHDLEASLLLSDTLEMLGQQAEHAGVSLRSEPPSEDELLLCDRQRVVQALGNFTSNAIKFTPAGGSVVLSVGRQGQSLCFSVTDTGAGMSQDQLGHVFDRFWQAERTAHLGTGLGLTIAKGIAEAHGGKAWGTSEPGKGSTFYLSIPCHGAHH